ncbi:MAG: PilC/PilY family type IV pilus protein [Dechloromonas sp.]|nr:PilC/PilY family type IV pilus protein [Dechloromonas sp.]
MNRGWKFVAMAICSALAIPGGHAATVKMSQIPLAKASTQPVPPNLLFILDDSGSMAWDYTPDYVNDSYCRKNTSTTSLSSCAAGMPPYFSSGFNKQYYDPKIRYTPGVKADGSSYPDMTSGNSTAWTKVPDDGYKSSSSTSNLVSQYPERSWCDGSDCKTNTTYRYPDANYISSSTSNSAAAYYFNLKPYYCTNDTGTNCSLTKGGAYTVEIPYLWCSNSALTTCQAQKIYPYRYPSFNQVETGVAAVLSFTVDGWRSGSKTVTSLKFDGVELLKNLTLTQNDVGNNSTNCRAMAQTIVDNQITTTVNKFTLTNSSCVVTLTAKEPGVWANDASKLVLGAGSSATISNKTLDISGMEGQSLFSRVNIVSSTAKYQVAGGKPTARTDCTTYSDGCSYAEEMTNFANWYAYYRTRILMMKSSASQAFKDIDSSFRVGYTQINKLSTSGTYVSVRPFDSGQRTTWYSKLMAASPSGGTPLRGALSFAGRVFAGRESVDDPVQYSCQQNFALLTTDGYWNGNSSGSGVTDVDGNILGDQDGGSTPRPYYQGSSAGTVPSLSDVAMYYYNTDLRDGTLSNCTSPLTGADVCDNNVPVSAEDKNSSQHMSTFTLGLGIDGNLRYRRDYKTATSGDYFDIKNGSANWPAPSNDSPAAIDDLWHAAVNGRGQYFSAQDPAVLVSSLKDALASISAQYGAGSAAATSTAEPVNGDNYMYVATYTTGKWTGNLEARTIDVLTGNVSTQAYWCAESIPADPARNLTACTGSMTSMVGATSDSRKIYFNSGGTLTNFTSSNLSAHTSKFDATKLNQYTTWSDDYKSQANAEKIINFLRGQTGFDTRDSNEYRLFRERESVLGDFVGSAPKYVCKASGKFTDLGYNTFSASLLTGTACARTPVVYAGGNDGMLHAFNATTGAELWAYVPTPVLSEMWRLADTTYVKNHRFFVDGAVTVEDVCISACDTTAAVWKTILVGALGAGVAPGNDPENASPLSGYFALDITTPASPTLLWELTSADSSLGGYVGYALGRPWIGKVKNAVGGLSWSVILSSGINPANGGSNLLMLDAYTGTLIRNVSISTTATGFSRFSPQVIKGGEDHTVTRVYGGDLEGNLWRIDPNTGTVLKIMTASGQAFTTEPELTVCNGKTSIYIGSGKFLEASDMTDKTQQTFYGLVDDYENLGGVSSPKTSLQQLASSSGTVAGTSDSGSTRGWYLDLPDIPTAGGAERISLVDPALEGNILTFASNIPESGICLASGRSKLYQLPVSTCTVADDYPKIKQGSIVALGNSLVVGIRRIKLPSGTIKILVTGSDGSLTTTSSGQQTTPPFGSRRVSWREIVRD